MNSIRQKLTHFMAGRYGVDDLGRVMLYFSLALMILSMFRPLRFLSMAGFVCLIICYVRMLSRNIAKRYQENQKYTQLRYKIVCRFNNWKQNMRSRKTHHIYKCPSCAQKVRVPRGKGQIEIRCPKCGTQFVKKS